ncbi:MAG: DUF4465 domain-containing protein [Flavobacteriales bacterium]
MKTITAIILSIMFISFTKAQTLIDFENFAFPEGKEYDNGENSPNLVNGKFEFTPLKFSNTFNQEFGFWSGGWAVSSVKDSTSPGFLNMYASRPGNAASGDNYIIGQSGADIDGFTANPGMYCDIKIRITNTTYAALSMRDGDMFGKKFGGETGDDPDYFFIRIKYLVGDSVTFTDDFYLADYRFTDNSQDYILTEWATYEGLVSTPFNKIAFELFSSDTVVFDGITYMNTPAFFAIDDVSFNYVPTSVKYVVVRDLKLFPNPTKDLLTIQTDNQQAETFQIIDLYGRVVRTMQIVAQQTVDVHDLASGVYLLRGEDGRTSRFVKQ